MLSSSYSLINASNIFISFNSTSLLEAYFLGKKSLNLLAKENNVAEINLLNKISKYDIVVSNPPYLSKFDYENVSDEISACKIPEYLLAQRPARPILAITRSETETNTVNPKGKNVDLNSKWDCISLFIKRSAKH